MSDGIQPLDASVQTNGARAAGGPETAFQTLSFDHYVVTLGNAEANAILGGEAENASFGLDGDDHVDGGAGDDILFGDPGNNRLIGGTGADYLEGGSSADDLAGGDGEDDLIGGDGADRLDAGAGHGTLDGGPGDDVLIGGAGPDAFIVRPGNGHDVIEDFQAGPGMFDHLALIGITPAELSFRAGAEGVTIAWNAGGSSVLLKGVALGDLAQDDFMFNEGRQVIGLVETDAGMFAATRLGPEPGVVAIVSNGDARTADIGVASTPPGDSANIETIFFQGYRVAVGTPGTDRITGDEACDKIWGRAGDDVIDGGGHDNNLFGDAGNDTLRAGIGVDQLDGGDGDDDLTGGDGENTLNGGRGNDRLVSGSGHDMIDGGTDDDVMTGGAGADAFMVNPNSGHDIVEDFDAGPGAFDHLALMNLRAEDLTLDEVEDGVRVSWNDGKGSILLKNVALDDLAQDDFMFVEAPDFVSGLTATELLTADLLA